MRIGPLGLLMACVALAACGQSPTPAPAPTTPDALAPSTADTPVEAPADTWDASRAPVVGTTITLTPDPVPFCDAPRQAVEVAYDLAAASAAQPQIWAEDRGGRRNLWAALKEPAGSKRSGDWVTEGMRFVAIDGKSGQVLNSVTVTAASCP